MSRIEAGTPGSSDCSALTGQEALRASHWRLGPNLLSKEMDRETLRGTLMSASGLLLVVLMSFSVRCASQQSESLTDLVREFDETQIFWQQLQIARKLVARNDRSVLPRIEPYLRNEDRHVRGNAAFVFAGLGDERGLNVIYDILQDRSSPRREGQGIPGGRWALAAQIKGDRYYAVHLLGLLKNPRAVAVLVPYLRDHDISYKVPWALGEIGDKAAISPLNDALNDPSPDVRVSSIEALEALGATDAVPMLRLLLQDNERIHTGNLETVSESAQSAITKLSAVR
jgi:HEAT repeat protein